MTSATHKSAQNTMQSFLASYLVNNPSVAKLFNEKMAKKAKKAASKKAAEAKEGLVPAGCARVYIDMGGAVCALVPMSTNDAVKWARAAACDSSQVFLETMAEACDCIQFDPSRRGFNYRPVLRRGEPIILRVNSQGYMVPVSGAVDTVRRFRGQVRNQEVDVRDLPTSLVESVLLGVLGGGESVGSIHPHIRRPESIAKPADVKFGRFQESELSSDDIVRASGVVSWGQRHNYIAAQLERLANWELWSQAYAVGIDSPLQKTREQLVEALSYELPKRYEGEELAEENEEVLLREVRDYWERHGSLHELCMDLWVKSLITSSRDLPDWGMEDGPVASMIEYVLLGELGGGESTGSIHPHTRKAAAKVVKKPARVYGRFSGELEVPTSPAVYTMPEKLESAEVVLKAEVRDYWERIGSVYNYLHNLYFRSIVDEYVKGSK